MEEYKTDGREYEQAQDKIDGLLSELKEDGDQMSNGDEEEEES